MECDILWHERFNTPENNYADFRDAWLRLAANHAQHGQVLLLCGCITPEQIDARPRKAYFSETHYCAIVLSEEEFRRRGEKMKEKRGWDYEIWHSDVWRAGAFQEGPGEIF